MKSASWFSIPSGSPCGWSEPTVITPHSRPSALIGAPADERAQRCPSAVSGVVVVGDPIDARRLVALDHERQNIVAAERHPLPDDARVAVPAPAPDELDDTRGVVPADQSDVGGGNDAPDLLGDRGEEGPGRLASRDERRDATQCGLLVRDTAQRHLLSAEPLQLLASRALTVGDAERPHRDRRNARHCAEQRGFRLRQGMGPRDDEGPAGRVLERGRRRRPRADARDLEPGARGAGAHSFELVDGGSPLRESNGGHEIAAAHDCRDVGIERLGRPLDRRSRGGCLCLGGRNRRDELRDVLGREVRRAHLRDVQTKAQVVRNLQRSMTSTLAAPHGRQYS